MAERRPSVTVATREVNIATVLDDEAASKVPIPSALPTPNVSATPLPWISLTVLSITVMGEFLCANVSTPFLLFMVRGFGVGEDEAEVGYWTGILVSVFFLTQFATSLVWATLADTFGRRTILFVSLLGSTITCTAFGTQKTFQSALAVRLVQGVFAGAIGVARSGVTSITDASNEGRVYAIMGFAWGFGGVIGAVIGGTFESPARKWPDVFARFAILHTYPYLLPCAMASSITLAGAVMCLFLNRDGGPKMVITKPKPEELLPTSILEVTLNQPSILDDVDAKRPAPPSRLDSQASAASNRSGGANVTFAPAPTPPVAVSPIPAANKRRRSSARSRRSGLGMMLGTPQQDVTRMWTHRRSSAATRLTDATDLNLAERLITASENQVTSMAQFWVAAAISADAAVTMDQLEEDALEFESDDELDALEARRAASPPLLPELPLVPTERTPLVDRLHETLRTPGSGTGTPQRPVLHRAGSSATTTIYPAIFINPGVEAPVSALVDEPPAIVLSPAIIEEELPDTESAMTEMPLAPRPAAAQQESLLKSIPALIVLQYGLLALHTTTHDQVFYSYLMSRYSAGGLGLTAVHFSQLIAIMSVAQIVYQFYFYPYIGPPRGRLSHLAMFRLGSVLFIPSYATVVLYRGALDGLVMPGLILSTAVRYCATTFAFTSITILLNYLTPPHAVGFANGLAQSIASLARFAGPALGAKVWEASVKHDPSGYAFGFWLCAAVCLGALAASYAIR